MKKVMIFGTFDIIHGGHIHMFKEAKEYGDYVIAVVARDINVERIKQYGALHSEKERLDFLKHIDLIDEVILGDKTDVYKVIKEKKPDIIALGYDQKVYVDKLEDAITSFGLNTKIVKLTPYRANELKSNKIRKYIERLV
ncbi:MAG: adenylyltransferase/cytidyltransferase family protein [Candidatus Magasanikiibacteriota bacterium]